MSFRDLAQLLLPVETDPGAAISRAGEDWRFEHDVERPDGVAVWGQGPKEKSGVDLLRWAARREEAVARLRARARGGLKVTGVHRWSWSFARPRRLPRTVAFLRSGAVVELRADTSSPRAIDAAARAAGSTQPLGADFQIGSGGAVTARIRLSGGGESLLRVGLEGSAGDPAPAASGLRCLEPLGLPRVPALRGSGTEGTARWTSEEVLPGTIPERVSAGLLSQLAEFLLTLPRADGPPTSLSKDLHTLAAHTPGHGPALLELLERHLAIAESLPAVMRHGDLWTGNVLVHRGRLSGVVDWDGWHPAAVPGTDLLHVVGVARALATRASFAEVLTQRPWEASVLRGPANAYWDGLGVSATSSVLETVGLAWWAARTAHNVSMNPADASDRAWIARNVAPVLASGL